MAAAVTEPGLAQRQALLTGGGSWASAPPAFSGGGAGGSEPGLKQFQTVVVLSIETEAGAELVSRLEQSAPSDLGSSCFKGCAAVLLELFASVANRREHGGAGKKNWMMAAHAELPVRRIQVGGEGCMSGWGCVGGWCGGAYGKEKRGRSAASLPCPKWPARRSQCAAPASLPLPAPVSSASLSLHPNIQRIPPPCTSLLPPACSRASTVCNGGCSFPPRRPPPPPPPLFPY
jgi:hypothetical protein